MSNYWLDLIEKEKKIEELARKYSANPYDLDEDDIARIIHMLRNAPRKP